jgi:hypothetical protein
MALDTTPGGAGADSYASEAEANTYNTDRRAPTSTTWSGATIAQREAALRAAAILLDRIFIWTGAAVDGVQARSWPRTGMLTGNGFAIPTSGAASIPIQLKEAQAEFAIQLFASDRLSDNDAQKQGITSVKAGSVAVTFSEFKPNEPAQLDAALRLMGSELAYLSKTVPDAVRLLLVDSWYTEGTIIRPAMFGSMA